MTETMSAVGEAPCKGGLPHRMQQHIAPLDGLRGWAAVMVVCSHVGSFGLNPLFRAPIGNYGVFLFFVLSGFLMGHLYLTKPLTRRNVVTYFAARISRIVPLYYAVIVAGYLLGTYATPTFPFAMSHVGLLRHLAFTGNISVFWSIGPEFQFYFLFPVAWWLLAVNSDRGWTVGVVIGWLMLLTFLFRSDFPGILIPSKLHIFVVGVLLAFAHAGARKSVTLRALILAQLGALLFLGALLLPPETFGSALYPRIPTDLKHNEYYQDFAKLLALAFVVLAFTFETKMANLIFANRLAKLLGKYSFSIYLLHVPVLYTLQHSGVFARLPYPASILLIAVLILLLCAASFRFLEEPSRIATRNVIMRLFAADRGAAAAKQPA